MLLAGDIGATKAYLALYSAGREIRQPDVFERINVKEYSSLAELIISFVERNCAELRSVSLGLAAPISDGTITFTNLDWQVDVYKFVKKFNGIPVSIYNDVQAMAAFIPELLSDEVQVINQGNPVSRGTIGVLASGTGLGEAYLVWQNGKYTPMPSEGGHSSFSPENEMQIELLDYLRSMYSSVSFEDVCSGGGIVHIYKFLEHKLTRQEIINDRGEGDRDNISPAHITANALDDPSKNPLCVQAVNMYRNILASEAGNLALKLFANGGIYLGGGIVNRLISSFDSSEFMDKFTNKRGYSRFLKKFPIHIVKSDLIALYGAAQMGLENNE